MPLISTFDPLIAYGHACVIRVFILNLCKQVKILELVIKLKTTASGTGDCDIEFVISKTVSSTIRTCARWVLYNTRTEEKQTKKQRWFYENARKFYLIDSYFVVIAETKIHDLVTFHLKEKESFPQSTDIKIFGFGTIQRK